MGAVCSSMSNTFSGAEPDEEQDTTRPRSAQTQRRAIRRVHVTPTTTEETPTSTTALKRTNSKSTLKSSDNKLEQPNLDSFMSRFGPVDEEQLYIDSYWWAQPKDDNDDDAPWNNTKTNNANVGTAINKGQMPPNKMGGATAIDPVSSESKLEQDPFENHPFFTMNIKRLTKPASKKTRSESTRSMKGGDEKSSKEKERENSKNAELSKYKVVYDDKKFLTIYPVLGDMRENVDAKCHSIHEAIKSDPDDRDKKLIKIYSSLSVVDRAFIPEQYETLFSETLASVIETAISGPFGSLIVSLSYTIEDSESEMIQTALDDDSKWSCRNDHLLRVLCGRNNEEIIKLKETYEKTTEKNMDSIMLKELQKGAFHTYMKMCLKTNACEKYDPKKKHTKDNAKKFAKELSDGKQDTDDLLGIFVRSPPTFLRQIDQAYEKKYKKSVTNSIKKGLKSSTEDAVLYGVGMSLDPFENVAIAMEKTFKGETIKFIVINRK